MMEKLLLSGKYIFLVMLCMMVLCAPSYAAFTLTAPAAGATVNTKTPTFTWNAEGTANSYVLVIDNDGDSVSDSYVLRTVTNYTVPSTWNMNDGTYQWRVMAKTNPDGTGSSVMNTGDWRSFIIDTTPPVPSVLIAPINNAVTGDSTTYPGGGDTNVTFTWDNKHTGASSITFTVWLESNYPAGASFASSAGLAATTEQLNVNFAAGINESYIWQISVFDAAGNASTSNGVFHYSTIATTAPVYNEPVNNYFGNKAGVSPTEPDLVLKWDNNVKPAKTSYYKIFFDLYSPTIPTKYPNSNGNDTPAAFGSWDYQTDKLVSTSWAFDPSVLKDTTNQTISPALQQLQDLDRVYAWIVSYTSAGCSQVMAGSPVALTYDAVAPQFVVACVNNKTPSITLTPTGIQGQTWRVSSRYNPPDEVGFRFHVMIVQEAGLSVGVSTDFSQITSFLPAVRPTVENIYLTRDDITQTQITFDGTDHRAVPAAAYPYASGWDGGNWMKCIAGEGTYTIPFTMTDRAGNKTQVDINVIVDNTPPQITEITLTNYKDSNTDFSDILVYTDFKLKFSESVYAVSADVGLDISMHRLTDQGFMPSAADPLTGTTYLADGTFAATTDLTLTHRGDFPANTAMYLSCDPKRFSAAAIGAALTANAIQRPTNYAGTRDRAGNLVASNPYLSTYDFSTTSAPSSIFQIFFTDHTPPEINLFNSVGGIIPKDGMVSTEIITNVEIFFDEFLNNMSSNHVTAVGTSRQAGFPSGVTRGGNDASAAARFTKLTNVMKVDRIDKNENTLYNINIIGTDNTTGLGVSEILYPKNGGSLTRVDLPPSKYLTDGIYRITINGGNATSPSVQVPAPNPAGTYWWLNDRAGYSLGTFTWKFVVDTQLPQVATIDLGGGNITYWTEPRENEENFPIDQDVIVRFTEDMDPTQFTAQNVKLYYGPYVAAGPNPTDEVSIVIIYYDASKTLLLRPFNFDSGERALLQPNRLLTVDLSNGTETTDGIRDINLRGLAGDRLQPNTPACFHISFQTNTRENLQVISSFPPKTPKTENCPLDITVQLNFNRAVDFSTVYDNIKLYSQNAQVPVYLTRDTMGDIIYLRASTVMGSKAGITNLTSNTQYSVVVNPGLLDTHPTFPVGADAFNLTFSTLDTIGPKVLLTDPQNGEINVPRTKSALTIEFDEAINPASLIFESVRIYKLFTPNAGSAEVTTKAVPFVSSVSDNIIKVSLDATYDFDYYTTYVCQIFDSVTDTFGNHLTSDPYPYSFSFTTEKDTTPLIITNVTPSGGSTNVPLSSKIKIEFNKEMDTREVTSAFSIYPSIAITSGVAAVPPYTTTYLNTNLQNYPNSPNISWLNNNTVVEITPLVPLTADTVYSLTLSTQARDRFGYTLSQNASLQFKTLDNVTPGIVFLNPAADQFGVPVTSSVQITFNEPISTATTNSDIILKTYSSTLGYDVTIDATVTVSQNIVTLTPVSLQYGTYYTVGVLTTLKDLAGNNFGKVGSGATKQPYYYRFKTVDDTTTPTVVLTVPTYGATNQPLNSNVVIRFSKEMNTSAVEQSITVLPGIYVSDGIVDSGVAPASYYNSATDPGNPAYAGAGTISWANNNTVMSITPFHPLSSDTTYSLTLSPTATDKYGYSLAGPVTLQFSTIDVVTPGIVITSPLPGSINVGTTEVINVTFTEDLDPATVVVPNVFLITYNSTVGQYVTMDTTVSYSNKVITVTPSAPLAYGTYYTLGITPNITDIAGNRYDDPAVAGISSTYYLKFRTIKDIALPRIVSTYPVTESVNIPVDSTVTITFSKPMDRNSVENAISLNPPGILTGGPSVYDETTRNQIYKWTNGSTELTITPLKNYSSNTQYIYTLDSQLKCYYGYPMTATYSFRFKTIDSNRPRILSTNPPSDYSTNPNTVSYWNVPVNQPLYVKFSKVIDPNSLNVSSLLITHGAGVSQGTQYVTGTVTGSFSITNIIDTSGNPVQTEFVFTPDKDLYYDGTYTVTLYDTIQDLQGNAIVTNDNTDDSYSWMFSCTGDQNFPRIVEDVIYPAANQQNVTVSVKPWVSFDTDMDASSINGLSNFLLQDTLTGIYISGTANYNTATRRAYFTPTATLAYNKNYTCTIKEGMKSAAGRNLQQSFSWSFTTEPDPFNDTAKPYVTKTTPPKNFINVGSTAEIYVVFSERIDPGTINLNNFLLSYTDTSGKANIVNGTVEYFDTKTIDSTAYSNVAVFNPYLPFASYTKYTMTLKTQSATNTSLGIKDIAGNYLDGDPLTETLDDKVWSFTSQIINYPVIKDIKGQYASSSLIQNRNVPTNEVIIVEFSKDMNTVDSQLAFSLTKKSTNTVVTGAFSWTGLTLLKFTPAANMSYDTEYTIKVTNLAKDTENFALAQNYSYDFKTTTQPVDPSLPPRVSSITPVNGQASVSRTETIRMIFTKSMKTSSVENEFKMQIQGTSQYLNSSDFTYLWSRSSTEVAITPKSQFDYFTTYKILMTAANVEDIYGIKLSSDGLHPAGEANDDFESTFTTITEMGQSNVGIAYYNPSDQASDVKIKTSINIAFTNNVLAKTISSNTIRLYEGLSSATGTLISDVTVYYNETTYIGTLLPKNPLKYATSYTVVVDDGILDQNNERIQRDPPSITFFTEADAGLPYIIKLSSTPQGSNNSITSKVTVTFNESMKSSSINSNTIKVFMGSTSVEGKVVLENGTNAIFTPLLAFPSSSEFRVVVSNNVEDLASNKLNPEDGWSFTTKDSDFELYAFQNINDSKMLTIYAQPKNTVPVLSVKPSVQIKQNDQIIKNVALTELENRLFKGVFNLDLDYPGMAIIHAKYGSSYQGAIAFNIEKVSPLLASRHSAPQNADGYIDIPQYAVNNEMLMLSSAAKLAEPAQAALAPEYLPTLTPAQNELIPMSDAYTFGKSMQLSKQAAVSLGFSRTVSYKPEQIAVYKKSGLSWQYCPTSVSAFRATAHTYSLGTYALFADTLAPRISQSNIDDSIALPPDQIDISSIIEENGSGIEEQGIEVLIDNFPVDFEYDAKEQKVSVDPDSLDIGYHTMAVTARDRAGNISKQAVKEFALAGGLSVSSSIVVPSPAVDQATFRYFLSSATTDSVRIEIFDISGDRIATIYGPTAFGYNETDWDLYNEDGYQASSGIYLYRITAEEQGVDVSEDGKFAVAK